jgi:asparagine synthase (glutamine-hydrolysing)
MCGIIAILDTDSRNIRERTENALHSLCHRGPDGSGHWQSPDGCVSLGHRRLAIQDIHGGAQPLSNEDNTVVAVVNGEFYDFEPIREQLAGLGHRFQTASDSEILIHLYEQWGFDCLTQLQGEFAFVLWDERRHLLWAARDRFGVKPLYYAETSDGILFSSEIKGLKQAGLALTWDEEGFFEQFIFQTCFEGRTLYRGVSEVLPGHFLTYQSRAARLQKYWDLDDLTPHEENADRAKTEEFQAEALLTVLDQAVRSRLQTALPTACYLSGGIDSTSVCALLKRNTTHPVQAFSLRFADPEYDEFPLAQQSAAALDIGITEVPISEASLALHFPQTVWHCESLVTNANAVAKFCLSRAVREAGFRIVLTGEGADELFAGYPRGCKSDCVNGFSWNSKETLRRTDGDRQRSDR